jgi:hypothetical protein
MNIQKELSEISLPISEPEYRQLPELSYSTLSTYESVGFNGIEHLFDRKESQSLTFGSCVDAIITGGENEFYNLFYVADIPSIGDKGKQVADYLFNTCGSNYFSMIEIPATYILDAANTFEFQKNWKDETRVKVLTERCGAYYAVKTQVVGKTIIDIPTFESVKACVRALRESPATCGYFADNDELSPVRRYYQLKFRAVLEGVGYRCMSDLLVVNYEKKKVFPVDLKTSLSCTEWDFEQNFKKWHYYIQARLYWRIIRANMDKDDFFKDFSLEDYRFIIVNPKSLTPLVWEFPLTKEVGTLIDDYDHEIRDPFEIGKELQGYLDCKPQVPNGINMEGLNTIKCIRVKE